MRKFSTANSVAWSQKELPKSQQVQKPIPQWLSILMLICVSTMNLGNYYCFDLPQAFQTPFHQKYNFSTQDTQALYTVYSLPNTILPFFGGILVSKIGDKISVLIFSMAIYIGMIVFIFGIWAVDNL